MICDSDELLPLVSVILPVYNRPGVIKTILSVINQTYKKLEIIVIDNCSTDNTVELIKKINDPRIKLFVNEENKGQTFSLNRGLKISTGKYIARIDSDDLMYSERIKKQVDFLENNEDYVICGSSISLINDYDEIIGKICCVEDDRSIRLVSTYYCPFAHPAVMFRRSTVIENSLFYNENFRMAEDYDLWVRMLCYGKGHNLTEFLTYYRQGEFNDSFTYRSLMKKETIQVMRNISHLDRWSCCNLDSYSSLISLVEKQDKNIWEIFRTILAWKSFLKMNLEQITNSKSNLIFFMKKFLINFCFYDNHNWLIICLRKLYRFIKYQLGVRIA